MGNGTVTPFHCTHVTDGQQSGVSVVCVVGCNTCPKSPWDGCRWTLGFSHGDRVPGLLQHGNQLQLVLGPVAARQSAAVGDGACSSAAISCSWCWGL